LEIAGLLAIREQLVRREKMVQTCAHVLQLTLLALRPDVMVIEGQVDGKFLFYSIQSFI
jgi:hypothetical protein